MSMSRNQFKISEREGVSRALKFHLLHSISTPFNYMQLQHVLGPKKCSLGFTNLHQKAALLQILRAGRNPSGHHKHFWLRKSSKNLASFSSLPFWTSYFEAKHDVKFIKMILTY